MIIGQKEGTLSTKNQIAFPKEFRIELGDLLIVTKGLGEYLIIVSEKNWSTLLEGTENKPFINTKARETQRYILGNASFVEIDNRGRFILPDYLKKHAGISGEVVFAGIDRFVEMWDKKIWEDKQEELKGTVIDIADSLEGDKNS